MPAADVARLIAQLVLDDRKFNTKGAIGGLDKIDKKLGAVEGSAYRVGQGIGTGIKNIAKLGVVAAGGIAVAVKSGLDDLAELETAVTSVDGAIQALNLTGKLTGKQVAGWANDIERDIGAAFDDKEITAAAATLLRFGKVTPANLKPALTVMTDLAAKTGSIDGAASLLAKALADPEKAAGKLARTGVILTKQQQDQIKAMVKAGDVAGAQALLLDEVARSTKGAALASQGPYARALAVLSDTAEDARKALAVGFLPVIEKVATKLSNLVADPRALAEIEGFGKTLAGAFDSLLASAERIPWGTIGQSLKLAGTGAKAVLDAFVGMPPWVQTAVLTGWGLNKLTGGALGGIVGELGKGLVKGVLGMNAGVVNINAATVNGGGVAGVPGAAAKGLGLASKVFLIGEAIGLGLLVNEVRNGLADQSTKVAEGVTASAQAFVTENQLTREQLLNSLSAVDQGIKDIQSNPLNVLVQGSALDELQKTRSILAKQLATTGSTGGASPDERQEAQRRFDRGISPDAGDSKNLQTTASNTGEMRTEFIADRKAAEVAAARIGEMRTEFNLARGENLTASLNSSSRLDSLRQLTANVQTGVVTAVNNMSANVTAAIAGIRLVPPTINVPRPPTPVVNVNISNRAVNTAVSRNTTFTRPL